MSEAVTRAATLAPRAGTHVALRSVDPERERARQALELGAERFAALTSHAEARSPSHLRMRQSVNGLEDLTSTTAAVPCARGSPRADVWQWRVV